MQTIYVIKPPAKKQASKNPGPPYPHAENFSKQAKARCTLYGFEAE